MAKVINLDTVVMSGATDNVVQVSEAKNENYLIETLPHPAGAYTFTIWVYAFDDPESSVHDDTSVLTIHLFNEHKTFELVKNLWTKLSISNDHLTGHSGEKFIIVKLLSDCGFRFYHAMLEQGINASDWTVAPEDTTEEIDGISDSVDSLNDSLMLLKERVSSSELKLEPDKIMSVVQSYDVFVNKDDATQIAKNEASSSITQYNDQIDVRFRSVNEVTDGIIGKINEQETWQRFDNEGIHIGKTQPDAEGHTFTMDLSERELAFNVDQTKVAYINNQTMHIKDAEIETRMKIGKFAFVPTETGMALIYVG